MSTAALLLAMLLSSGARAEGICGSGSSYPIAGTSGFQNALQALRVNAQTYSASRFAERNLLEARGDGEEGRVGGRVAWESTVLYGATSLPSYQSEAVHRSSADCPLGYAVALRPVDLQSNSLGFSVQRARLGFFYSASVVFGQVAESSNYVRGMLWSGAWPIYSTVPLLTAPLTGNWQTQSGASAFALDFIVGASYDTGFGTLNAGWAGSKGAYLNLSDLPLGLFGTVLLRGGDRAEPLDFFRVGAEGLSYGKASKIVGRTSAFVREIPLVEIEQASSATEPGESTRDFQRLSTGHLSQRALLGVLDLGGAWAWRPVSTFHEGFLSIHTRGFVPEADRFEGSANGVLLQVGFIDLPEQRWYGVEGGRHLSGELWLRAVPLEEASLVLDLRLLYNSVEILDLHPYAIGALAYSLNMRGSF